jgi:hypothetical protein
MAPSCIISPRPSVFPMLFDEVAVHCPAIAMPVMSTRFPVGGMPMKSPVWVAFTENRAATRAFLLHVTDGDLQVRESGGHGREVFLVALETGDDLRPIETAVVPRDEALDAADVLVVAAVLDVPAEDSLWT